MSTVVNSVQEHSGKANMLLEGNQDARGCFELLDTKAVSSGCWGGKVCGIYVCVCVG